MPGPIPRISQSDLTTPSAMERVAAVANSGHLFSVSEGMEAHATPGGRGILHFPLNRITDRRLCALASSPYTDSRYRLLVVAMLNSSQMHVTSPPATNDPIELAAEVRPDFYPEGGSNNADPTTKNADVGSFITAHNTAEILDWADSGYDIISGSHLLLDRPGTPGSGAPTSTQIFEAWCVYDDEANPQPHWFFCLPPPEVIYVGLTVHSGTSGAVPANWTYDLSYRGATIATNQTPIAPVHLAVPYAAATSGIAVIEPVSRKNYILYYANESPDTTSCS